MPQLTPYHAKYFAHDLTRQLPANDLGKLTASLQDAQVDLNPHQVEAALFAFKSPLSKGAILADEVGLGKTIEAGIILSQQWAEGKRQLLIICPANLRKQWNRELADKFYLSSVILETGSFNQQLKAGNLNPFKQPADIVICSYHFAHNKAAYLKHTAWDLVVIDEAHRLRNVYKPNNRVGNGLKDALDHCKKVLLTATPLQNSILELYGLVSLIDPYVFGDLKSFKAQFSRGTDEEAYADLRARLQPVCKRTLRRQVLEYIQYTSRKPLVQEYFPSEEETALYDGVSEYLQRPQLYALPSGQRQLMTLILRKLLASSTYAIGGTLQALAGKLEDLLARQKAADTETLAGDFEAFEELEDEWVDDEEAEDNVLEEPSYSESEQEAIKEEMEYLERFSTLAHKISKNSKAEQLFTALERGFEALRNLGANQKALLFTESRRTQDFLFKLLEERGYKGKVVRFNGSNTDTQSARIYAAYQKRHKGTDVLTGSATADKRAALVEFFKEEGTIMVATEAAAEGINLQFCSLVINFDLPWNPQRIEQRIGRCHRYGQKHDVVVINFLNKANAADQRVYELLDEKFKLFDGVFGASDEVLGSIGNGVDFEKRIAGIYQQCRTTGEIQAAFDALQQELKGAITEKVSETRKVLLENFDEEVRDKLRHNWAESTEQLGRFEARLWALTEYFLAGKARFQEAECRFILTQNPFEKVPFSAGPYQLLSAAGPGRKSDRALPDDTSIYRIGHPLAVAILNACKALPTPTREVVFDYSGTPTKISALEGLIGQGGWLQLSRLRVKAFETEEHLLFSAFNENGVALLAEVAARLFSLQAEIGEPLYLPEEAATQLAGGTEVQQAAHLEAVALRNQDFFDAEIDKLDSWAEDQKKSLDRAISDLDAELKLKKAEAKRMPRLADKVEAQRAIKELERLRAEKRRSLYETQDAIDNRKEALLTETESRLEQQVETEDLFTIAWSVV